MNTLFTFAVVQAFNLVVLVWLNRVALAKILVLRQQLSVRIVFITTFNEWYEGTAVEPGMARRQGSHDYGFDYLDAIRDVALKDWCR